MTKLILEADAAGTRVSVRSQATSTEEAPPPPDLLTFLSSKFHKVQGHRSVANSTLLSLTFRVAFADLCPI